MPLYRVRMCRDTSQSIDVEVLAPDRYQAEEAAYELVRNDWDLEWEDDDYTGKPYCPDPEDIKEIRP